jgi:Holliday junction resolvasome RuvABC ATP-dependent DNA helicase subunit
MKIKAHNCAYIKTAGDLAGVLTNCEQGDILLMDKLDLMAKPIEHYLSTALETFLLTVTIDQGLNRRSVPLSLERFTLIATATCQDQLSPMLLVGFPISAHLDSYTPAEFVDITRAFSTALDVDVDDAALNVLIRGSNGTPKDLLCRMRFVKSYARNKASSAIVTAKVAEQALTMFASANKSAQIDYGRTAIPSEIRREVWRRDAGKCVKCGSRERLEYDHIIPVIKGGSSTARNIELLCEACNRSKRDSIQ